MSIKPGELKELSAAAIGLDSLAKNDFKILRDAIGSARVVCIGEESHGTEDFYRLRASITKALIKYEGFTSVLCEADFPPFWELNRFVGGTHKVQSLKPIKLQDVPKNGAEKTQQKTPRTIEEAMSGLHDRFPVWMWHNEVLRDFVLWLREHNESLELPQTEPKTEFETKKTVIPVNLLGLDIYSLFTSADEVIKYLDNIDPEAAKQARRRYSLLGSFRPEIGEYTRAVHTGIVKSQADRVAAVVKLLEDREKVYVEATGDGDEFFSATENARVVAEAEQYYRMSFMGGSVTWNLRDKAMVDMIRRELLFQDKKMKVSGAAKAVVWAHNSHLGDARATEHVQRRQCNVGALVRELYGEDETYLLGLTTHHGTVRAAKRWSGRDTVMELIPSLSGSAGDVLHKVSEATKHEAFGLLLKSKAVSQPELVEAMKKCAEILRPERLQRFVGVCYVKATEKFSHYSLCRLSDQYNAVIHIDETKALKPLEKVAPPADILRPGTVDYSKFQMLARDLPEEELSEEEM